MKSIFSIVSINLVLSLGIGQQNFQILIDEICGLDYTTSILNVLEEEVKVEENKTRTQSNFDNFINIFSSNSQQLNSTLKTLKVDLKHSQNTLLKSILARYKLYCCYVFYH